MKKLRETLRRLAKRGLQALGYDLVHRKNSNYDLGEHLRNVLRLLQTDLVVDVGANEGQFGSFLRSLGYSGWIVSFEPASGAFARLEQTARADARWLLYPLALGASSERRSLQVNRHSEFSSFLELNDYALQSWRQLDDQKDLEEAQIVCLDELFPDLCRRTGSRSAFLKLDTQGYELEVLRGAAQSLESFRGLQAEVSQIALYQGAPDGWELLRWLRDRGFFVTGFYPVNRETDTLAVVEYDVVAVRRPQPGLPTATKERP